MTIKRILRYLLLVLLLPVALVVVVAVLLYVPPVQNWAAHKVAASLSESTGKQISVGRVSLSFPLDLGIDHFLMTQRSGSATHPVDTIADAGTLRLSIQLLPLLHNEVRVDRLLLSRVKVNTVNFISDTQILARIGTLDLRSRGINWQSEQAIVDKALLSNAQLTVLLCDTAKEDTTPSTAHWRITLDRLRLRNTDFHLHMPGDSMTVAASFGKADVGGARLDLNPGRYSVKSVDWRGGSLAYDLPFTTRIRGFDANHIALSGVRLLLADFSYFAPNLKVNVLEGRFRERCGLQVDSLALPFSMDSTSIHLPSILAVTPGSRISGRMSMDMNAFDDKKPGRFSADIDARVAKADINAFTGGQLAKMLRPVPSRNIRLNGRVSGNLQRLSLHGVRASVPGHVSLAASGELSRVMQDSRSGRLRFSLSAPDARFLSAMLLDRETRRSVSIPRGIAAAGTLSLHADNYGFNVRLSQGGGRVAARGVYHGSGPSYDVAATARNFHIQHFLPTVGARDFTGTVAVRGTGTDFMSRHTRAHVAASVASLGYERYQLSGIKLNGSLARGIVSAHADSRYGLARGSLSLSGIVSRSLIDVKLLGRLDNLDLYHLGLTQQPLTIKGSADMALRTDLRDNIVATGRLGSLSIADRTNTYNPGDLTLDFHTSRDTTLVHLDCGDLHLHGGAGGGYKRLMAVADRIGKTLERQIANKWIDQRQLFAMLPNGRLSFTSGDSNVVASMLRARGFAFRDVAADVAMQTGQGINGFVRIDSLTRDTLRIDSVYLDMRSDDGGLKYALTLQNFKDNPQYQFRALLDGSFIGNGTNTNLNIWDSADRLGISISLAAMLQDGGVRMKINAPETVLGYKKFRVNDDNFAFISSSKRLTADMKLLAADGAGVQVYTDTTDTTALQDVTISMHQFELEKVFSVLPFAPQVSGVVNGDFHAIQTPDQLTVSADISTRNLTYQNCPMGNLGAQLVYLPQQDGTHMVNGILTESDNEVGAINGSYSPDGVLDATLDMERLPLGLINGFIPDQIVGLKGTGEGSLTMKGKLSSLDVNGEVFLDSSYLVSVPYGVQLRFADDPVRIVNSKLLLENFEMFANNDQPLDIKGELDFSNLDDIRLDAQMRARNFQLIDAKENPRSTVFGKTFIDFFGSISGPLSRLKMRGLMNVLGSTDMTYVMRDSELATDNQLAELVNFVDLSDTLADDVTLPPLEGFNLDMQINIDESARIFCALNSDKSNYADLMGDGKLRMQYNDEAGVRLSGRYTLSNGEVKYSLPIIPLRTFTIADGSYIDFDGDPMNPRLNITATENVKANVATSGSAEGRSVDFTTGVQLSNRLAKPGILFIINAPNDRTVEDELNTMSTEERAKVAVTMLASGIYVAGGNTSSFSMNSALSSFLNTEINNIAGRAIQSMGLDLQMGVENSITSKGDLHTDYSFQFSKRFFNNRLSVLVGGKVSTGAQINESNNNTFFDNVELQYRLGDNQSRYIRAFYNNSTYDWLDGLIGEYGVGFRWRRQLDRLSDLFRFKSAVVPPVDSTKKDTAK